ncbi:MAG: TIGR04372 family glycosyltransferase, partial [bacterium]|nr:TIGR04372 family glycosyltransferase [bacterium]
GMFYLLKPLKKIKIAQIRTDRIGHLAANNDAFLRKKYLEADKTLVLGFVSQIDSRMFIANHQLFKMLKRKMFIVKSSFWYHVVCDSRLFKSEFYIDLVSSLKGTVECHQFDNAPVNLEWTKSEEEKGRKHLKEMGIDSWFVCFHSRDGAYLKKAYGHNDLSYHDYRDCDIDNYLPAMEAITKLGGYAVRMGSVVAKPLENHGNPRIIDYATRFRSDFMDIYLSAKCKFFVGNTAGLMLVPVVFNVPLVSANYIPAAFSGISKREILLPKKIRKHEENRYLGFPEIFSTGVCRYLFGKQYKDDGLIPIENSGEEIEGAVMEMNERLDGKWKDTKEDLALQNRYREIFKENSQYYYDYTSRIGSAYLSKNRDLL